MKWVDILDLLMVRYGNLDYFNKLPLKMGLKLIRKCQFEQEKTKSWDMWIATYPYMSKENFVPFSKFFTATMEDSEPKARKTAAELLAEAEEIQKRIYERGHDDANI
jgi:hypothetical protein